MKVILLMHMSSWQQFCHSWWGVAILSIVTIALFIIGGVMMMHDGWLSVLGVILFLSTIAPLCSLLAIGLNPHQPNPRANTAYSSSDTIEWKNNANDYPGTFNLQGKYYHDDYLTLDDTKIKIAKTHWTNEAQTITPLNSTGRAWMTVANKIQTQPKPHAHINMDVHLSYTKGSIETPQGTKKFVCYVNNKHQKDSKDYQVLEYK